MAERHFQRTSATQSGLINSEIPSNDDQRMIRMKEGDTNAFEELIEEWQGPLLGFFLRKTGDRHLSEDLVQETLLRLYRSVSNYVVMNQFRGFLFRIARNLLMDHSRRAERNLVIRAIRNQPYSPDAQQLDPMQQIPDELLSPADAASKREVAESGQHRSILHAAYSYSTCGNLMAPKPVCNEFFAAEVDVTGAVNGWGRTRVGRCDRIRLERAVLTGGSSGNSPGHILETVTGKSV
jgi:RNA polymerase sigma factor (sigma-70 family)